MKNLFIYNQFGVNEIVTSEYVGVDHVKESEWDVIDVESDILLQYAVYDTVVRVKVEDFRTELEVLREVDRVEQKLYW